MRPLIPISMPDPVVVSLARIAAAGILGFALLFGRPARAFAQSSTYEQLQTFSGVLNHIRVNYVDSVNNERLVQAAITGMLRSLDPHSYYVSRKEFELRAQWDQGLLASPGIALEDADGVTTVLGVSAGSPASKAGIQPGDRLVALNDSSVAGVGARSLEVRLLGEKGSRLRMTLERGSLLQPDSFSVTLKRAIIEHHVVSTPQFAAPAVGYVRFSEFTMLGAKELMEAIRKIRGRGAKSLILDLRGNPGGDVTAMVQIASAFLPERTEVFHTQGRKKSGFDQVVTREKGDFLDLPLIVLVDEGSASASEMLTGSLQDHDRALVVGRRSFGKALMQTALPLPGGDVVWLTVARVVTPSGRIIQRRYSGIAPEQYRALAGKSGAAEDTLEVFHTDHGRTVRGGGGIVPDMVRATTAELPGWFTVAADSGLLTSVADSVATGLGTDAAARTAWMKGVERWDRQLVTPFVSRVHSRLGITVEPDTALRHRLGRILAARATEVRFGSAGEEEFLMQNDPDIQAALGYVAKLPELLAKQP